MKGPLRHGFASITIQKGKKHPIYIAWVNMRQRCSNPNKFDYKFYGGKGVQVNNRWQSFDNFCKDMLESFEKHRKQEKTTTLDRIDVSGNYCKENCRWATRKEQANNRTINAFITYKGKSQSAGNWIKELGLKMSAKNLYKRIFTRGWNINRAFTQPLR